VLEQSGIYAGEGGFDVTVGNHTQLNGAVIASQADASKNRLETGTLGFTDIYNEADYKTEHQGIGISSGASMGGQFAGNMANTLLAGAGSKGHTEGTTQSAVAEGTIGVRDQASQQQSLADLSRDPEHTTDSISPIFNKEKEQQRLQAIELIGELGGQMSDIAATQGALSGLDTGTGSDVQRSIQAVTAALQGLAGGDVAGALAGASAPELAHLLKGTESDPVANTLAHALLGGVVASLQGNNAAAGALGAASGELAAKAIMAALYPGKTAGELSESEKQTVSMLATVSAGIAGGLAGGNTAGTVTGAQAGKNAVENNFLSATSSDRLDKVIEKIKQGDKSLSAANELLKLENADKRSDALVSKFTKAPSDMTSTEWAELSGYLRIYASEMEQTYGSAVAQQLVTGLLSGQDYMKRSPDSEAMSKAQSIMNTWGYHKSNASIGDAPLIFGTTVLGTTIKGMAVNMVIGVGVNTGLQLAGKDPFSYVDGSRAGVTAAAKTGKGGMVSIPINMGGAAIGSVIKGEDPTNSVAGAGFGSLAGGIAGKVASEVMKPVIKDTTAEVAEAAIGSIAAEVAGNKVKEQLDHEVKNQ